MILKEFDFDRICRLCTKDSLYLSSLYDNGKDGIPSVDKLNVLCGVQIKSGDAFPKQICKSCRQKLENWYEFRNMCLISNETLIKYQEQQETLVNKQKEELADDDDVEIRYYIEVEEDYFTDNNTDINLSDVEPYFHLPNIIKTTKLIENKLAETKEISNTSETQIRNVKKKKVKTRKKSKKQYNYDPNKQHKCKVCNKRFGSEIRVKLHMQRIHKQIYLAECKVVCPKCGMKFQHIRNLKRHLVYHNTDSYFGCNFCDKKLYSKKSWRKHVKIHDGKINDICKICNKTNFSKISHMYHMEHHRTKEILTNKTFYSCHTCNLDFEHFEQLEKHSFKQHCLKIPEEHDYLQEVKVDISETSNNQRITSEQFQEVERNVERIFSEIPEHNKIESYLNPADTENKNVVESTGKEIIQNGNNNIDSSDNTLISSNANINASVTFKCNICSRFYKNLPDLNSHVSECYSKINRPKSFMCDVCGKCFASYWTLTSHKAGHSSVRKFICDICGQRFKWHNDLTNHKNRIHEKFRPYVCKICGNKFGTTATLKSHLRSHNKERPYSCKVCEAVFAQSNSLKEHMLKHTGGQEDSCPICLKVFKTALRLRTHIKRHNSERKLFPCDLCGRMFTEKSSVRKHKVKIHNEVS